MPYMHVGMEERPSNLAIRVDSLEQALEMYPNTQLIWLCGMRHGKGGTIYVEPPPEEALVMCIGAWERPEDKP